LRKRDEEQKEKRRVSALRSTSAVKKRNFPCEREGFNPRLGGTLQLKKETRSEAPYDKCESLGKS